jgi:hypothetical protein
VSSASSGLGTGFGCITPGGFAAALRHDLLVYDKIRKNFVLFQVWGFCSGTEGVPTCLLQYLFLADPACFLGAICTNEHMLQIFVAVFLDPVKYLIVFHFKFLSACRLFVFVEFSQLLEFIIPL